MKTLFTIGFTKRTAEDFFTTLEMNKIRRVIDVRLSNRTQLSTFAKYPDIEYFLRRIVGVDYVHDLDLAPSPDLFNDYKSKRIDWPRYIDWFNDLMYERSIADRLLNSTEDFDRYCLLCSDRSAEFCHRRLVAEFIRETFADSDENYIDVEIVHL